MASLDFESRGVDLSRNARAPLAPWAAPLQARAHYADRGRGPDAFDCLGIACFVQGLVGRRVRDYLDLYADIDARDTDAVGKLMEAESCAWIEAAGDVGDVLVLGSARRAHHVAVLCGAGRAMHASGAAGIVIEEIVGRRAVTRLGSYRVYGVVAPA